MQILKLLRDLARGILTYGTIITLALTALIWALSQDLDLAEFFAVSLIVCYCITGFTMAFFACIEKLPLKRRTVFLLYIPASIAGTAGGVILAQSIISGLFDGIVVFRGIRDLPQYIIVGLIVSGFATLFDYMNTTRKEKQRQFEKEKERAAGLEILNRDATIQMLRSRLNPHFLFNTLNTISELIHQDPGKAEKAVVNLSEIYRQTLDMSEEDTVTVYHELELMEKYLENERMRFGDRLQYRIDADPGCIATKIPALIL